jgi:hypothetical protein
MPGHNPYGWLGSRHGFTGRSQIGQKGATMSSETSTAALRSFRRKSHPTPCRAPRHPAGAKPLHSRHFERSPRSEKSLFDVKTNLTFRQAELAIHKEHAMNPDKPNIRTILPVILRVTLSLVLWTLGASMTLPATTPEARHSVYRFSVDRAKIEDLQRWVNAGHDDWCRDPQLVAADALRQSLSGAAEIEFASVPLQLERSQKTVAVYTVHSVDGQTTYRITLRRFNWLLPIAGSMRKTIWAPEQLEITTHNPTKPATTSSALRT